MIEKENQIFDLLKPRHPLKPLKQSAIYT